jgi:hypothetical protein
VARVVEQVRVDVQRDRGAGVAKDPTDLRYVQTQIQDQVAREGVAEIVEAQRRPSVILVPGASRGALQRALGDVAMPVRCAVRGREHPIGLCREPRVAPVLTEQLEQHTGASQKTVAHTLELLHAHGIVESTPDEPGTPGRPSRRWRLATEEELAEFERCCDAFESLLLRKQLEDYDE